MIIKRINFKIRGKLKGIRNLTAWYSARAVNFVERPWINQWRGRNRLGFASENAGKHWEKYGKKWAKNRKIYLERRTQKNILLPNKNWNYFKGKKFFKLIRRKILNSTESKKIKLWKIVKEVTNYSFNSTKCKGLLLSNPLPEKLTKKEINDELIKSFFLSFHLV